MTMTEWQVAAKRGILASAKGPEARAGWQRWTLEEAMWVAGMECVPGWRVSGEFESPSAYMRIVHKASGEERRNIPPVLVDVVGVVMKGGRWAGSGLVVGGRDDEGVLGLLEAEGVRELDMEEVVSARTINWEGAVRMWEGASGAERDVLREAVEAGVRTAEISHAEARKRTGLEVVGSVGEKGRRVAIRAAVWEAMTSTGIALGRGKRIGPWRVGGGGNVEPAPSERVAVWLPSREALAEWARLAKAGCVAVPQWSITGSRGAAQPLLNGDQLSKCGNYGRGVLRENIPKELSPLMYGAGVSLSGASNLDLTESGAWIAEVGGAWNEWVVQAMGAAANRSVEGGASPAWACEEWLVEARRVVVVAREADREVVEFAVNSGKWLPAAKGGGLELWDGVAKGSGT